VQKRVPTLVNVGGRIITLVKCGGTFCLALDTNNTYLGWGYNVNGT
jgi:alpha-tubulin suppressor-like RCC1 family protein